MKFLCVFLTVFAFTYGQSYSTTTGRIVRKRQNSQMNLAALSALAGLNQMPNNNNNFGPMNQGRSGSFLPFSSAMSGNSPFDNHNNYGASGLPNGVNLQSVLGNNNPMMSSMMMSSGPNVPQQQNLFGQNGGQMPMMSNMYPNNDQTVDVSQYRALMSALSGGNGGNNNNNNFMPNSFSNPQNFQNFGQPGMNLNNLNSMMGSSPVLRDQSQFMGGNSDILSALGNQLPNNNFFPNNNGGGGGGGGGMNPSFNPNLMFGMSNPYASVQQQSSNGYNRGTPQDSSMNLLSALISNNVGSYGSPMMPSNNFPSNNMRMNMPMANSQQQSGALSTVGMQVRVVQVPLQNGVSVPVFQLVGNNDNHKRSKRQLLGNLCGCKNLHIRDLRGTWTQVCLAFLICHFWVFLNTEVS